MADLPDNKTKRSRVTWIKILIPVLIVIIIAGMFFVKNKQNAPINSENRDTTYPLKITVANLEEIKAYGVPTVIDFGSDSCIPCKEMAPVLEALNAEWKDKAAVQFMDVWKYTEGVQDFPVQVIPTQVFFTAEGKPFVPSEDLSAKIPFQMYSMKDSGEHVFTVHQGGITEEEMRMIFDEMGVK